VSNRKKRQPQRRPVRPLIPAPGGPLSASAEAGEPAPPATSAPAPIAVPGYASGVYAPRRAAAAAAANIDIDARVPYFSGDLRRIVITAGVMLAIIVAASFFVR
jgi:hypothetical protein